MVIRRHLVVILALIPLAACETFLAHYRMPENLVTTIGKLNAVVNHCLSNDELNKADGYAFNSVSVQFIDISVLDRDFYKQRYEEGWAEMERRGSIEVNGRRYGCVRLERELPEMTADLFKLYSTVSGQLRQARAAELRQMSSTLGSFGRSGFASSTYTPAYEWPKVTYVDQPNTANYLVNTSKGLVQCRVTNKNYVFCM